MCQRHHRPFQCSVFIDKPKLRLQNDFNFSLSARKVRQNAQKLTAQKPDRPGPTAT